MNIDIKMTSTPAARAFIKEKMQQVSDTAIGLRIGVKRTGCSGYAYTFDIVEATESGDQVFPQADGVNIAVSADSLDVFQGAVILDYVREGLSQRLVLVNPKEKNRCGCGESFVI